MAISLSDKQRRILACAALQAEAPLAKIQQETGCHVATIRQCLQRLRDCGAVHFMTYLNGTPLGLVEYGFLFSISSSKEGDKQRLLKALASSEEVMWLGDLAGQHQYGATILARNDWEVSNFLDRITEQLEDLHLEREVAVRLSSIDYGSQFLWPERFSRSRLEFGVDHGPVVLDEKDHQILRGLMSGEFSSFRKLARDLKMPASTLDFRINQLRKSGVLVGFANRIFPPLIGYSAYLLLLYTRGNTRLIREDLRAFCARTPSVRYLIHRMGNWDHEVSVVVKDPREVKIIEQALFAEFGSRLDRVVHYQMFDNLKFSFYPFRSLETVAGESGDRQKTAP